MAGPLGTADSQLPAKFPGEKDLIFGQDFGTESDFPSHIFPTGFPYHFDSFDSPVEGSTETDSSDENEDEFLVGLSRRLSRFSSRKLVLGLTQSKNKKSGEMATSPQSTLRGIGSWSIHSNGSSKGPSQVPSPTTTPFPARDEALDLISAAAGEIARLKMNPEAPKCNNGDFNRRNIDRVQNQKNSGLYSIRNLHRNLSQSNQVVKVKPQCAAVRGRRPHWRTPLVKYQQPPIQSRNPLGLPQSSWPALGENGGVKRESIGTGVFLPRRYGNFPDYGKKFTENSVARRNAGKGLI